MKICTKCKVEKEDTNEFFYPRNNKLSRECRDCRNSYQRQIRKTDKYRNYFRERYHRDPEVQKKTAYTRLKSKYGITAEEYEALLLEQDNKCYLCNKEQRQRLAVDHSHKTGRVRRLLCINCNTALSKIENEEWFTKALDYLDSF